MYKQMYRYRCTVVQMEINIYMYQVASVCISMLNIYVHFHYTTGFLKIEETWNARMSICNPLCRTSTLVVRILGILANFMEAPWLQ